MMVLKLTAFWAKVTDSMDSSWMVCLIGEKILQQGVTLGIPMKTGASGISQISQIGFFEHPVTTQEKISV